MNMLGVVFTIGVVWCCFYDRRGHRCRHINLALHKVR